MDIDVTDICLTSSTRITRSFPNFFFWILIVELDLVLQALEEKKRILFILITLFYHHCIFGIGASFCGRTNCFLRIRT